MVTISSLPGAVYVSNTTVSPQKSAAASVSGSTAAALTSSPSNTSTESFTQVVLDARATLNAGYQKLGKTGDDTTNFDQWENVVGLKNMDRRTLYAISSNQGGLFSQAEIDAAGGEMAVRESNAMTAADPLRQNPAAAFKAAADYLDQASPEEKTSLKWAEDRGSAQAGYLLCMQDAGRTPENVSTGNPVVDLFAKAHFQLSKSKNPSLSPQDMPAYKQAIQLWSQLNEEGHTLSLTL
jgi:hypothetical protein